MVVCLFMLLRPLSTTLKAGKSHDLLDDHVYIIQLPLVISKQFMIVSTFVLVDLLV